MNSSSMTEFFAEQDGMMTDRSNATLFSTIMSEGGANIPRDFATKDLLKKNFLAIQKFQSL